MKRLLLAVALSGLLAACAQKPAPTAEAPPAPAAADAASAAPAAAESATDAQPAAAAESTAATTAAPAATSPGTPIPGHWQAGTNYQAILPVQPTSVDPGQVEVIEFMWLGCPHCYEMNPYVEAWRKKLPAYVKFRQEHIMWGAPHAAHAKLFYTLEALGRDDLISKAFDEIHRNGNNLVANDTDATRQLQEKFALSNGISEADFLREYNGFAVNTRLQRATDLMKRYRVDSVPTFIVNGKYHTDVGMAGGPTELLQLLSDLAASEKAH